MKDYFTPDYMFATFDEITPAFLQSIGVRALLIDIDNTLAPYEQPDPDERIMAWFAGLEKNGIRATLISNNHAPRVERFNKPLLESFGIVAYPDSGKPFAGKLKYAMERMGVTYTETRRIRSLGTNFEKLDRLNALSRKICAKGFSAGEVDRELAAIEKCKPYSVWVSFGACALIASAFTLFFGGNLWQALAALFIGCGVHLTDLLAERTLRNPIFCKFASASVLTALVFWVCRMTGLVGDEIIIGNIMLLVSGLGFTNALRDLFTGESFSGILRLLEAVLCAVAIAAGYFFVAFLGGVL